MKRILLVASLLASLTLAYADDESLPTLKVGKHIYTNLTVTSVTTTYISFLHSGGMATAKLKDLEPDMQEHFGYDPAKARMAENRIAYADALYNGSVSQPSAPSRPARPVTSALQQPHFASASGTTAPRLYAKSFLNQPAPTLDVEKWLTPVPNMQGKFVLIDFWATWCGPCRASIPHLNELQSKFKDRLTVIGLSNQSETDVRKMTSPAMDYAVAIDTQRRTYNTIKITGIPHAMLIDPKGVVRYEGHPKSLTAAALAKLLDEYGG